MADYTYDTNKQYVKSLSAAWDSTSLPNSADHQTIHLSAVLNPEILTYSFELWSQKELNLNAENPELDVLEGPVLEEIKDGSYPNITYPKNWAINKIEKRISKLIWTSCLYDNAQITNDVELCFLIDNTESMNIIIDRVRDKLYDIVDKFIQSGLSVAVSIVTINDIVSQQYQGLITQWVKKEICPRSFDMKAIREKINEISKGVYGGGDILEPMWDGAYFAITECIDSSSDVILFMMGDNEGKVGGVQDPYHKSKYSYQDVKNLLSGNSNIRFFFYGYNFESGSTKLYRGSYKPSDTNYPLGYESVPHSECTYLNELATMTGGTVNGDIDVVISQMVRLKNINFAYTIKEVPDKDVYILRCLAETINGEHYEYDIADIIVGDRTPPQVKKPLIRSS